MLAIPDKKKILRQAQAAGALDRRIAQNVGAQRVDLVEWIFDRLSIEQGSKVLELCCGTGAQTQRLLDLVRAMGQVVAVDISHEALERLEAKVKGRKRMRLALVETDVDDLQSALLKEGLKPPYFDLCFCAYGLYYSKDVSNTLDTVFHWLKPQGRTVIVGPFGPNNGPLFDLLERGGVLIPTYVRYTSTDFMLAEVAPWAAKCFRTIRMDTLVNHVAWNSTSDVLEYWRNSTYYDPESLAMVERLLEKHFGSHTEFVNEKWIMMVEASNARK